MDKGKIDVALRQHRAILITERIDVDTVSKVRTSFFEYVIDDPNKEIFIILDCPGGGLNSAFGIYDILRSVTTPVVGIALNRCISATIVVYAACDKRLAFPNAQFGFHAVSFHSTFKSFHNTEEAVRVYLKDNELCYNMLHSICQERYNISKDKFEELNRCGEWYDVYVRASEAKELSIVHEIITTLPFDFTLKA